MKKEETMKYFVSFMYLKEDGHGFGNTMCETKKGYFSVTETEKKIREEFGCSKAVVMYFKEMGKKEEA